jgi:hypothetical protein
MSREINDLDLGTIDADPNDRTSGRSHIDMPKVGGFSAIKGIFIPANKGKLIMWFALFILVVGGAAWSYMSVKAIDPKANGGVTTGGNAKTKKNSSPSKMQVEEGQRYNEEELQNLQKEDPTAHPIVVTEDNGEFGRARDFKNPDRVSKTGESAPEHPEKAKSGHAQQNRQKPVAAASREQIDLINKLMLAEGTQVPQLQSVSWTYQQPVQSTSAIAKKGAQGSDSTDYDSDGVLSGELPTKCKNPIIRAGHQYVARSTMAVNSDVGGPVILELVNGPLRKNRLIGKFERKDEWMRMEFNSLVGIKDPVKINAIGLDMTTVLNAVGGDVNYHTFYRYGWWGVGTVLSAIGKAAENNADTQTIFVGDNVVQDTQSDTNREIKMALGDLGQSLGEVMKGRINTPLTVTVNVNDLVGVVFMDDVCGDK